MEEEQSQENVVIEKPKNTKEFIFKIIVACCSVLIIAALILYKMQNPEFSLRMVILIIAFLIIISLGLIFGFSLYRKFHILKDEHEKSAELPKSLNKEELKKMVKNLLESKEYQNHIKRWDNIRSYTINKNLIYCFEIEPLYIDDNNKKIAVIINSHFPNNQPTILFNYSDRDIYRAVNSASTNPEPPAEIEKTEVYNPMTQTMMKTEKRKPKSKKNEKKVGDLE